MPHKEQGDLGIVRAQSWRRVPVSGDKDGEMPKGRMWADKDGEMPKGGMRADKDAGDAERLRGPLTPPGGQGGPSRVVWRASPKRNKAR